MKYEVKFNITEILKLFKKFEMNKFMLYSCIFLLVANCNGDDNLDCKINELNVLINNEEAVTDFVQYRKEGSIDVIWSEVGIDPSWRYILHFRLNDDLGLGKYSLINDDRVSAFYIGLFASQSDFKYFPFEGEIEILENSDKIIMNFNAEMTLDTINPSADFSFSAGTVCVEKKN